VPVVSELSPVIKARGLNLIERPAAETEPTKFHFSRTKMLNCARLNDNLGDFAAKQGYTPAIDQPRSQRPRRRNFRTDQGSDRARFPAAIVGGRSQDHTDASVPRQHRVHEWAAVQRADSDVRFNEQLWPMDAASPAVSLTRYSLAPNS